jgi:DNA-binding transcriptional ArsR family regulator
MHEKPCTCYRADMDEAPPPRIADVGMAKAMANPVRQRILRVLHRVGEATSTTLASELAMTTGATSYNLRVLAKYGLVEEVPERARGRERWWRTVPVDVRFAPRGAQDPSLRAAVGELNQAWLTEDFDMFARFQQQRADMGEWGDALPYSRGSIKVSLTDLEAFFEDYLALLRRYQRGRPDDPAADVRTVHTRFIAFPDPEEGT